MPKNGFPMPTAKNRFQILNLHPKNHVFKKKKKHGLKGKKYPNFFPRGAPLPKDQIAL